MSIKVGDIVEYCYEGSDLSLRRWRGTQMQVSSIGPELVHGMLVGHSEASRTTGYQMGDALTFTRGNLRLVTPPKPKTKGITKFWKEHAI